MEDIKPIRVFLKVAEHSSFVSAARALNITPASVTRIIARLESDLDQQLFLRTTRQVSLTSGGALIAARYRPVIEELDRATDDLLKANTPNRGRLKINAPISMGLRLLPALSNSFQLAYPNIALSVKMTDTLVDIMEEKCDLAIRISGPPNDKSTIWRKICQVPRHAVAAPSLFEQIKMPNIPEELRTEYCLSYSAGDTPETWEFQKGPIKRNMKAGTKVISNNGDYLYELALKGSGIVVLPDFIVNTGIVNGDIVRILPDWDVTPLWLTLYYPPYEQFPPLVATFTEFFEAFMRKIDGMNFNSLKT